jgi:hypothetical protein
MRYEVHAVEGAAMPRFRTSPDINAVADEIAAIYTITAKLGGQVVAGHTLVCDHLAPGNDREDVPTRIDYLFLVSELPDSLKAD